MNTTAEVLPFRGGQEEKDLYEIGEIPPLGHVPKNMYAWAIREERHGEPDTAMQCEVLPVTQPDSHEVLVLVMAAGVNYNGSGHRSASRSRSLTRTTARSTLPDRMHRASSGQLGRKSPAGKSVTKLSFTATRMMATTKNVMVVIRCCPRRSESGVTKPRMGRSHNLPACRHNS